MSILTQCPNCQKSLNLPDSDIGRQVICPGCKKQFTASRAQDFDDDPAVEVVDEVIETLEPIAPGPGVATGPTPVDPRQLEKVGVSTTGARLLLAVCFFLTAATAMGIAMAILKPAAPAAPLPVGPPPRPVQAPNPMPLAAANFDANMAKIVAELNDKIKDGPLFDPVFPPPPVDPTLAPNDLDEAIALTSNPQWIRAKTAAEWIGKSPVIADRQRVVNDALFKMLRSREIHQHEAAGNALLVWADEDARTDLLEMAKQERSPGAPAALLVLARLKDERAAPVAALQLSHFRKRAQARRVLETLGPVAEKDVAAYLENPDAQTRVEACQVLAGIGTTASIPALEAAIRKDPRLTKPGNDAIGAIRKR